MIFDRLKATLARDEGCNLNRYQDSLGIDTIGYGVNLEEEMPNTLLEYLGVNDEDDIQSITQEQADYLLAHHTKQATQDCQTVIGEKWNTLTPLRQEILINLMFNLGRPRFRGFRKMIAAINVDDWKMAAAQMLDSKAAKQTGHRYVRLAYAFETNDETHLELNQKWDVQGTETIAGTVQDDAKPPASVKLTDIDSATLLYEIARRMGLTVKQEEQDGRTGDSQQGN